MLCFPHLPATDNLYLHDIWVSSMIILGRCGLLTHTRVNKPHRELNGNDAITLGYKIFMRLCDITVYTPGSDTTLLLIIVHFRLQLERSSCPYKL